MNAWDYDKRDSEAVRYWKSQARHWQTIAILSLLGGTIMGALLMTGFISITNFCGG